MSKQKEEIPTLVACNLDALERLHALLESQDQPSQSLGQSCLARFKLWAGTLGAHRTSGTRSLEYRLRDASSLREHLISLLQELKDMLLEEALPFLQSGHKFEENMRMTGDSVDDELAALFDAGSEDGLDSSSGDRNHELRDILSGVGNILNCLLRFSVTISHPAPHDHFKSRAGIELTRHFEHYDVMHVRAKYPHMESRLSERLGRMLTYRRRYFKYRADHHCRLKQGLDAELNDGASKGLATTVASSLPQGLKDAAQMHPAVIDDDRSEISATSYAPSNLNGSELRVPSIPKQYIDGPFLCPFCYVFISVDSRDDWKKHVFRDLRPYACLVETCVVDHDFQRRKDWIRHMVQDHWRVWICPFGCVGDYSSSLGLRDHLYRTHTAEVAGQDVDITVSLSSVADVGCAEGPCPMCHDFQIKSSHQYQSHIGSHLEQLALFVLPTQDGDDDDHESTNEKSSSSQDNEFQMQERKQLHLLRGRHLSPAGRAFVEETYGVDMSNAYRRLSDANLLRSGGSLAEIGRKKKIGENPDGGRLAKGYFNPGGDVSPSIDDMYNDSSDDQDDSNAEEGERGRKIARSFDRLSPDSDKAGLKADKDKAALSLLAAGPGRERQEVEQGAVADVEDSEHQRIMVTPPVPHGLPMFDDFSDLDSEDSFVNGLVNLGEQQAQASQARSRSSSGASPVTRAAAATLHSDQSQSQRLTHSPEKDDPRSQQTQVEQSMPQDLERSSRGPTIDLNPKSQRSPPHIEAQIMDIENQIRTKYPNMSQEQAHGQALHIMQQRLMQSQVSRNSVAQNSLDAVAGSTRQQPGMVDGKPVAANPHQYAQMLRQHQQQQQQVAGKLLQEDSNREKRMRMTGTLYDRRLDMSSDSSSGSSKPARTTSKTSEPDQVYHNYKSTLPHQHDLDGPKNFLTADDLRRMREIPSRISSIETESGHGCSRIARNSMDPDDMTIVVKGMGSLTIGNAQLDIRDGAEIAIRTTGSSRDLQQDKDSASSPKPNP